MSHDDETCLKLGREVVRLIHELLSSAKADTGYTRRTFSFPGGEVYLFIANDPKLADVFDAAAARHFDVANVTPPSQVN